MHSPTENITLSYQLRLYHMIINDKIDKVVKSEK